MAIDIPAIAKAYAERAAAQTKLSGFDPSVVREIWEADAADVLEFAVPLILSALAEEGKISLDPLPPDGGSA